MRTKPILLLLLLNTPLPLPIAKMEPSLIKYAFQIMPMLRREWVKMSKTFVTERVSKFSGSTWWLCIFVTFPLSSKVRNRLGTDTVFIFVILSWPYSYICLELTWAIIRLTHPKTYYFVPGKKLDTFLPLCSIRFLFCCQRLKCTGICGSNLLRIFRFRCNRWYGVIRHAGC